MSFSQTSGRFRCVRLLQVTLPVSFYNVVDGWNNELQFTWGGTPTVDTIVIAGGQYEPQELVDALNAQLDAATSTSGVYRFVVPSNFYIYRRLRFENGDATNNFIIHDQVTAAAGQGVPTRGIRALLGLTGERTVAPSGNVTFNCLADFRGPTALYLDIDVGSVQISSGIINWQNRHSFLVPILAPFGETAYFADMKDYKQGERADNAALSQVRVTWRAAIPDYTAFTSAGTPVTVSYPLDFGCIPHHFLLELD